MHSKIAGRFSELTRKLRYVVRTWHLILKAAGSWTIAWLILTLIDGLIPAGIVEVTRLLVDAVAATVGKGLNSSSISVVLYPALAMGALLLGQRTIKSIIEWVSTVQSERVQDHAKQLIHDKASRVEYGFFETPALLDSLNQANGAVSSSTIALLQGTGALLSGCVSMIAIMGLISRYGTWIPFVLVLGAIPSFIVLMRQNKRFHQWWKASTQERRLTQYYDIALTTPEGAIEVRINNLGPFFSAQYQRVRSKLRGERSRLVLLQALGRFLAAFIGLALTATMMAWIVIETLQGRAKLGDLAMFYQAFTQGQGVVGAVIQSGGAILMHTLFLQYFFEFMDRPIAQPSPARPVAFPQIIRKGIRFRSVAFSYPSSEREALHDFDLFIPAGKIIAIVGENGAGKSTLTKLLCRFYDPLSGIIEIDGVDLRQFDLMSLRKNISLMPQWPVRYPLSAELNIRFGDLDREYTRDDIARAADAAEAREFLEKLPKGYDTQLGRIFDNGIELSGGQWQRVALARAFYRNSPIIVLDEPTSYMDSWAEIKWMRALRGLVQGKTTLLITHRFTTAMQADLICVLQEGRLIESGTHAQLVAANGHYAASWRTQMQAAEQQSTGDGIPDQQFESPDGIDIITEANKA